MKIIHFSTIVFICIMSAACKNESAYRVGALGDSITRGVKKANVPDELDRLLPDNYNIKNYGVAGTCLVKNCFSPIWNTEQFASLQKDAPDIITIMLGTNDANPTNSDSVRMNYERDYREMVALFQALPSKPRIILCYPAPLYGAVAMDSIIRKELIPIIDEIAKDHDLEVANTYYLVDDYPENYPDGLHPNKAGCQTLARIIADVIVN